MVDSSQAYDHHRENDLIRQAGLKMAGEDKGKKIDIKVANGRYMRLEPPAFPTLGQATQAPQADVDLVNHPPHYTMGTIEVLDFIEDQKFNYHLGQVIKYVCRSPHKGNELEDLKKAQFYLNRHIANLETNG